MSCGTLSGLTNGAPGLFHVCVDLDGQQSYLKSFSWAFRLLALTPLISAQPFCSTG